MTKAKTKTETKQQEFVPSSAASQDPTAQPAGESLNNEAIALVKSQLDANPHLSDRYKQTLELIAKAEATVFDLCDFLGWPRDLETFSAKIKEHSAVQDFIPHADDPILTLQAAGDLVGRSGQTIGNWIREGYVESELDPSGLRRVRKSKLLRFFRGTALASPFTVENMTEAQKAQYDVDVQTRYATIYCKYCQKRIIELTDAPALWLASHTQTCNAETFADANRPH